MTCLHLLAPGLARAIRRVSLLLRGTALVGSADRMHWMYIEIGEGLTHRLARRGLVHVGGAGEPPCRVSFSHTQFRIDRSCTLARFCAEYHPGCWMHRMRMRCARKTKYVHGCKCATVVLSYKCRTGTLLNETVRHFFASHCTLALAIVRSGRICRVCMCVSFSVG